MNQSQLRGGALSLLVIAILAGCNDDTTAAMPAPKSAPPATTNFETFTDNQVQQATCETLAEADVNGLTFSFPMDQDTIEAQEVSKIAPACTAM